MKKSVTLPLCTFTALADLSATTVIFAQGTDFRLQFLKGFYLYSFHNSLSDLWVLTVIRVSFILGFILAILRGSPTVIERSKKLNKFIVIIAALMWMFTVIKLLALADHENNLHKLWVWLMLSWSAVAAILFFVQWKILNSTNCETPYLLGDEEEREPLINDARSKVKDDDDSQEDEKQAKLTKSKILRFFSYIRPDWHLLLVGFIFLAIAATGNIFIPYYTGRVIDGIAIDKSKEKFTEAIIIMAVITVVSAMAGGIRGGCFFISIQRFNIRVRNILFSSIMSQEVGFFDTVKTGDITSRLTSDTTTTTDAISLNINIFLRNTITACGTIFFMIKLSWRMSLVTFIGLPVVIGVAKVYGEYYEKLAKKVQDSLAKANEVAEEACSSLRTVRSFANESQEVARYKTSLSDTYKLYKKQAIVYSGYIWCTQLFELSLTVGVLYYGGHLVMLGQLTGGNLISFILYQIQLGECLDGMSSVYTGLMQAIGASEKVFEYIDRKPKISNTGDFQPDKLEGHLEFKNVSFAYPSRPDSVVLKNVSFSVRPGEIVALVGPSGGGKSSCVNLLEHFYETTSGEVLLDSVPIKHYDHKYLHKKMSLVGQEPVLYARSVRENIAYGLEEIVEEEVIEAAIMANAHQFICEMKDKYDTQTGEKGTQLSGGQKQRVAIARALIRDPSVLILDEATSALDSESEHVVQQALYNSMKGRTVLIIAHRLSTIERAHRILVVNKGSVVEQGTHRELISHNGMYANLVRRQLLGLDNSEDKSHKHSPKHNHSSPRKVGPDLHGRSSPESIGEFKSCSNSPVHVAFRLGSGS